MTSSCWPTPAQILLLQAALFEGDSARRAFEAWRPNLSSTLDPGSKRLLSLLDRNLRAHRLAPDVPRPLAEAHQRAERENAALVNAVSTVLEAFSDRSIPAIVLKGMPLALAYYPTLACRPMDDCDLMVRQPKVLEARDVLLGLGWRLDGTTLQRSPCTQTCISMSAGQSMRACEPPTFTGSAVRQ